MRIYHWTPYFLHWTSQYFHSNNSNESPWSNPSTVAKQKCEKFTVEKKKVQRTFKKLKMSENLNEFKKCLSKLLPSLIFPCCSLWFSQSSNPFCGVQQQMLDSIKMVYLTRNPTVWLCEMCQGLGKTINVSLSVVWIGSCAIQKMSELLTK